MAETAAAYTVETFTAGDGYAWQYRYYASKHDPANPLGRVVCLHGIQSHAGWYDYSSNRLSEAGYAVYFLDRRGSGLNIQDRGDAPSFERLVDDVAEFVVKLQTDAAPGRPGIPVFLLAVSWGAKVAAALTRWRPGHLAGLALLCPGFFPRVRPTLGDRLRIGWSRLVKPTRMFDIPLNDPELFTTTPHWQDFLRGDPLSLHRATARFLVESVRLDRYLKKVPPVCQLPVLLLLAEHDKIIDNAATRRFVERFATADKEILEYAGAHHTLEFEPDPELYVRDLLAWLGRHAV